MNPRLIQDTVELLNHVGNSLLLKIRGNIFEPGVYVTVVSDIVACINGTYQIRVFFGFGCEKEKCSPVIGQILKSEANFSAFSNFSSVSIAMK